MGIGLVVPCIVAYHRDFPPVCPGLAVVAGNDRMCSEAGVGGQGPVGTSRGVGAGNPPCENMNHPE